MRTFLKETVFIIVGTLILAFGVANFILPYDVQTGGVAGIAVLLKPFLPLSEEFVASFLAMILLIIGYFTLGRKFVVSTALSTFVYSSSLIFMSNHPVVIETDPLLASMYGGMICGVGIGIVLRNGGSTGGMDIPPLIMNKYLGIDISKGVMIIDALTVISGLFIYNVNAVLVGLISVFFTSVALNKTMSLYQGAPTKSIQIISPKHQEISEAIQNEFERGTTILLAKGGYEGEDRPIVMTVVYENQYQGVIDLINRYDKQAFIIVSDTNEVHGEGFTFDARV